MWYDSWIVQTKYCWRSTNACTAQNVAQSEAYILYKNFSQQNSVNMTAECDFFAPYHTIQSLEPMSESSLLFNISTDSA